MGTFSEGNIHRIKLIAQNLRHKHDSMDWETSPNDLLLMEGLKHKEYDLRKESFLKKVTKHISNIVDQIKAAIFVKEKIIFIDKDLHKSKKPFACGHELGHSTIEEHREILYVCSEHDLNSHVRKEMEFEANVFAAEILFPEPLIKNIHQNFELSMETILYLSNISHGSIHASAINYIKTSDKVCCLLVLNKHKKDDQNGLLLGNNRNQIPSESWYKKYQLLLCDYQFFNEDHLLSKIVYNNSGQDIIKDQLKVGEKHQFNVHVFYNSFLVFALLFE